MSFRSPRSWLGRWEDGVRALHGKTRKPMVAVVIEEQPDGVAAYSLLAAAPADTEMAAKTLLGDLIAGIGGKGYEPGRCACCDERLARAQAAFALLEPIGAGALPGAAALRTDGAGNRGLH